MPSTRRSDPATSFAAAASITTEELRDSQKAVYEVIKRNGAMNDETLADIYRGLTSSGLVPHQSESGLRTRRAELVSLGLIVDTLDRVKMRSGRMSIVWKAVN